MCVIACPRTPPMSISGEELLQTGSTMMRGTDRSPSFFSGRLGKKLNNAMADALVRTAIKLPNLIPTLVTTTPPSLPIALAIWHKHSARSPFAQVFLTTTLSCLPVAWRNFHPLSNSPSQPEYHCLPCRWLPIFSVQASGLAHPLLLLYDERPRLLLPGDGCLDLLQPPRAEVDLALPSEQSAFPKENRVNLVLFCRRWAPPQPNDRTDDTHRQEGKQKACTAVIRNVSKIST